MSTTNNPLRGIILSRYRSIAEAARAVGMTRFRLADIVSGAVSPTVDEVIELATACDVPIADVVAASRHMRELHSASQCGPRYCNTDETAKKE